MADTEKTEVRLNNNLERILTDSGLLTKEQFQQVSEILEKEGGRLEQVLLRQRLISPHQLAFFMSLQLGVPFFNIRKEGVKSDAIKLAPESLCRKYNIIPVSINNDRLVVGMEDPRDIHALEDISIITKKFIDPVICTPQDIQEMIDLNYRVGGEIEE